MQIWDDGVLKVSGTHSVAVGITDTLTWSGPIGESALGVGVDLIDMAGESFLDGVDPFVLDGEAGCGRAAPVPMTGPIGLLALIGLLAAAGVFVLLRRR